MASAAKTKPSPTPDFQSKRALLTGRPPGLMMDNGDRADPLDPIAQLVDDLRKGTPINKRTAVYHEELAKAAFIGAMWTNETPDIILNGHKAVDYVDGDAYLVIPGNAFYSMLVTALGRQGKGKRDDARAALQIAEYYPLLVNGSLMTAKEAFELYDKLKKRVRVRNKRGEWVTATRPLFAQWTCEVEFKFQKRLFDEAKVDQALQDAGDILGLGACRSRNYGRFDVSIL